LPPQSRGKRRPHRQSDTKRLGHTLRGDLDWIVLKALEKDRARRYDTANALALDLRRHLNDEPVSAGPPSARYRLKKLVLRNKAAAFTLGTLLLGAIGVLALIVRHSAQLKQERDYAHVQEGKAVTAGQRAEDMLTRMQLQRAEELFDVDDASGGIAYLAHVLRRNPQDRITAARLLSALRDRSHGRLLAGLLTMAGAQIFGWEPDGKSLLITRGRVVLRWQISQPQPDARPVLEDSSFVPVLSPDRTKMLAFHGWDRCRLYDVRSGATLTPMLIHDNSSPGLNVAESAGMMAAFSPEGRWVATVMASGSLHLWDAQTGAQIGKFPGAPTCAAFHPDGKILAVGLRNGTVQIREADGKEWKIRQEWSSGDRFIQSLHFTNDRLVVESQNRLRLHRIIKEQVETAPIDLGGATSYDVPTSGNVIAVSRVNHTVELLSMETGKALGDPIDAREYVNQVTISQNGLRLLAVTNRSVQVWSLTGRSLLMRTRQFPTSLAADSFKKKLIHLSPDGGAVAIAQADGTVSVWEVASSRALPVAFPMRGGTSEVDLHPAGDLLATSNLEGGDAAVWNLRDGRAMSPVIKAAPDGRKLLCLTFQPGTERLWTGSDQSEKPGLNQKIKSWHWPSGRQDGVGPLTVGYAFYLNFDASGRRLFMQDNTRHVFEMPTMVERLGGWMKPLFLRASFSKDGQSLLQSSNEQKGLIRWNVETGEADGPLFANVPSFSTFFPTDNSETCVSIHTDSTARVWDTRSGRPLGPAVRHQASITDATLHLASDVLVTASSDKTARLWRISTGEALGSPMRHRETVYQATLSPDGRRVATSSYDRTVRFWDVPTGRPLTESMPVPGFDVQVCLWHPDGVRLITSGRSPAQCWDAALLEAEAPAWLPDWAEAVGGFQLDAQGEMTALALDADRKFWDSAATSKAADLCSRTLRWFYAPVATRPISPDAQVTLRDQVAAFSRVGDAAKSLMALDLAPGDTLPWVSLLWDDFEKGNAPAAARQAVLVKIAARGKTDGQNAATACLLEAMLNVKARSPEETLAACRKALQLGLDPYWTQKVKIHLVHLLAAASQVPQAIDLASEVIGTITPDDRRDTTRNALIVFRRDALLTQNKVAAAAADNTALLGLPVRAAGTPAEMLDLSAFYNARLDEGFGNFGDTFSELPSGVHDFAGVKFDVRGQIQLRARLKNAESNGILRKADPEHPQSIAGIPVGGVCRKMHFLHCSASTYIPKDTELGAYVIHYTDGQQARVPLFLYRQVRDRHRNGEASLGGAAAPTPPPCVIAWQGHNEWSRKQPMTRLCLYAFTWENPRPDVPIKSVDLLSNAQDAGLCVFGITKE
jgi:WD40 repeat protein